MSEKEFEIYLSLLSQLLRLSPAQKAAISDEFRDHMEQRLTSLLAAGDSRDDAIKQVMEEFGDVSGLATDLTRVSRLPARKVAIRSTVAASLVAIMIVICVSLFTPEHRVAAPPTVQAEPISAPNGAREELAREEESIPFFPRLSAQEAKIQQALNKPTSIDSEDKPLADALTTIENQSGIEIWIDLAAASDLGIDTHTHTSLKLNDLPLRSILKLLLNPLHLTYVNEDDVLKITPVARDRNPSARVYAVGDLFETDDQATQLLESIECGLNLAESGNQPRNLAISSSIGTLTVRQPFGLQTQVMNLLRAYRDARRDATLPFVAPEELTSKATNRNDRQNVMRSYPLPTAREAKIQRAVNAPTSGTWDRQPLLEVLNQIKTQHQFEIWVDEAAIDKEQIDTSMEVTYTADNQILREVLRLLLEPLTLTFVIEDDVMKITTQSFLDSNFRTRVYPVGDLVSTTDEAIQLLETIECGLGRSRLSNGHRQLAVSSWMKTLTVSDSSAGQAQVQNFLCALRDAQQAASGSKRNQNRK